jgi:hypothetical protein
MATQLALDQTFFVELLEKLIGETYHLQNRCADPRSTLHIADFKCLLKSKMIGAGLRTSFRRRTRRAGMC